MEILHTEPILTESFLYNLFLTIMVISAFLSVACFIIASMNLSLNWTKTGVLLATLFLTAIIAIIIIRVEDKDTTETGLYRYEVILEDDYSLEKIYDKYNIIEHKGKIWILEDKPS